MPMILAGDWGTTKLRLFVCDVHDDSIRVIDSQDGPGVSRIPSDNFESVFLDLVRDWRDRYDIRVVLLSGMVGSSIGWHEVNYLPCPARPDDIGRQTPVFDVDGLQVGIVPGLVCKNPLGHPDVIRGEETQLLNWSAGATHSPTGLVACPGTHNKWVQLRDGAIVHFMTALTGELYACLRQHSVLIGDGDESFDEATFLQAVDAACSHPNQLTSLLFSTRSLQVLKELPPHSASAYLSGLLIGADCAGAIELFDRAGSAVSLLGEPTLNQRYVLALKQLGIESVSVDASTLGADGYLQLLAKTGLEL